MRDEKLILPHGGYRKLKSFQLAQLVYDLTVRFCNRYIDKRSRTHDQMVQAARSGVQNIAEGSQTSGTSKKFEIKLTSVARASLEELKLDYEDYLRQRSLMLWSRDFFLRQELVDSKLKTVPEVICWVESVHSRGQNKHSGQSTSTTDNFSTMSTKSTKFTYQEIAANTILVLINVTCYLLDKQLSYLSEKFEKEGGFSERMYRIRKKL